ncbi:MAG: acriflavin resistance protein [Novosphingobium sp. 28-62-57]|uniref:efflux RND transporter permease subunit n=1 Tax=Novosphingobium sp. 28-62-57 TaxID=1970409 RepID=UPI000BDA1ADD|nr:efflux RND transporter permease subunit [Novosphingobium sp. 28-62-57]OYZ12579.1 MAG: acriflavin resistance protein [Novosphingobium sp. 28-62-57]
MLAALIGSSLRQRALVLALAAVLTVLGVRAAMSAKFDVFPEFAPPIVEVQTEAPGLATEDVEALVTVPIETAVNGVPGLATLRSKSVLGLSSVVLVMDRAADPVRTRQMVQERLATVIPRLPAAVRPPVMLAPLSATSRAMKIGIWSDKLDQMTMTEMARWTIRPRLMAVPGVANVAMWGARDRQLQVLVDPVRLSAAGVTVADVQRAAGDAVVIAGGGFVDSPNQRLAVRQVVGVKTGSDLASAVIRTVGGAPVRIGDVAKVTEGFAQPIGDAIINGRPGLLLIVEKQLGANTLEVARGIDKALAELRPGLKGMNVDGTIFRPATFIERALANLGEAMGIGIVLVAAVLILFTRNWRTALISMTAIPLSLVGAVLALTAFGVGMNTMVIAGLVIALGEIVDDAIIDVENIGRRLRLEAVREQPRSPFAVVLAASLEVRSAVVFASAIVMLVFLPVFFLGGVSGSFFRPLAMAYIAAIAASLLVALTVTPAMCLMLLPGAAERAEPRWVIGLRARYGRLLEGLAPRSGMAVAVVAGGILLSVGGMGLLRQQFLPDFRETDFLMHFVEKPGTSLEAMDRITIRASKELTAIPGVRNFGSHIGRAEQGDEVYGPNFTELWISLDEKADHDAAVKRIETAIAGYPGLQRDVLTYLRERIKEVLTGAGATVVVRLYGPDLAELRSLAEKVRGALDGTEGVKDLKVEQQSLIPQIQIAPRPDVLALAGVTAGDVRRTAATLIGGTRVGEIYRDQKSFDVAVWAVPEARSDLGALRRLMVPGPSSANGQAGSALRLGDLARVGVAPAAGEIKREAGSRRIDVTLNLKDGADLASVAQAVERKVKAMTMPAGYYPQFLGEWKTLQESKAQLGWLSLVCLVGILFLVWLEFRSGRIVALVALSLPFALVGGVAAAALGGGVLSMGALVGFVTVLGISARNGIMLLSHFRHLEREEDQPFGLALVQRGAAERLVPILMTAGTAALALLPLVAHGNVPGHEIEYPMALVILGGLVSSTVLNLVWMPALYLRFGKGRAA